MDCTFSSFSNQLCDSSLKTGFLRHDMKAKQEPVNKELQKLIWFCHSKKENKSISNPWIKTANSDFYTLILFSFLQEKIRKKCAHNRKHNCSSHHFATTLVLKYQSFSDGPALFLFIPRFPWKQKCTTPSGRSEIYFLVTEHNWFTRNMDGTS